jgi:hypothetical protein
MSWAIRITVVQKKSFTSGSYNLTKTYCLYVIHLIILLNILGVMIDNNRFVFVFVHIVTCDVVKDLFYMVGI